MADVVIFSADSKLSNQIARVVVQYTKEVLGLEAIGCYTAIKHGDPFLGMMFRVVSDFSADINLRGQEADLRVYDNSPLAYLARGRHLLDLYQTIGNDEPGIALAHELIVLERVIPDWLAAQNASMVYFYPSAVSLGVSDTQLACFEAVAKEFNVTILPSDIDAATDEVGTFVEDILGMNPGE